MNTRGRSRPAHVRALLAAVPLSVVVASLTVGTSAAFAAGATYYVDQGSSTCSDSGSGSSTAPFCTITKAANTAKSGDAVQVAAGTYHEQVLAPSGVTFLAASPAAVVDGTDELGSATWTAATGTAFSTVLASSSAPKQVLYNGTALTVGSGMTFTPSTRTLTVDTGGTDPTGSNIAAQWSYGFASNSTSGVVIDGFSLRRQIVAGVNLDKTTNATVRNVTATLAGSNGVNDNLGSGDLITSVTATGNGSVGIRLANTTTSSVTSSTASNNGNHGISVQGGSGAHIADNVASGNLKPGTRVATGIDVSGTSLNAVIERNTTYGNDDSGIEIYIGSTGATVRRNVTYDNGDHGIDISKSPNATVVSNTVVGNNTSGINVEGLSTNTALRDNVSVDNAVGSTRGSGNIRIEAGSDTGTTLDRDLVFQSDGASALFEWSGTNYYTLAAMQTVSGQEARGLAEDPKFVDLKGRDLHLTHGSSAVDAADSDASGWVDGDRNGNSPVDQTDVADTGHGPVTYADLGALELTSTPPPVDQAPTAALTAAPNAVQEGQSSTLDASTSTDDHGITGYVFDCGDGTGPGKSQTGATTSCTYAKAGTYTPSVTVTDTAGKTATASATVTVTAAPPVDQAPVAALTATPSQIQEGGSSTLDASGSTDDHGVTGYAFNCDNGSPAGASQPGATTSCSYGAAGTYHPSVTVTDGSQTSTATTTVTVVVAPPPPPPADNAPHAALTSSSNQIQEGDSTTLDASGSSDDNGIRGYSFSCDGGNAGTQNGAQITCSYPTAGTYHPSVTVTDTAGQTDIASTTVTVAQVPGPDAKLTLSKSRVRQGEPLTLDASGSTRAATYTFDCGNGTVTKDQTAATATCAYVKRGSYSASVTVTDSRGRTATMTLPVTVVRGTPPTARLSLPGNVRRGQVFKADASRSTGSAYSAVTAYRFQCGHQMRGPWRAKPTARCQFLKAGWHTVTVWVRNDLGLVATVTKKVYVRR
ncbi:MAG: PKD domain-containing protein [Nocardioidaceae bacterium]